MSRLESMIRRLEAQVSCLNWAIGEIAGRKGSVLELGLGNGRTFDHLRESLADREILVFDRQLNAHPDCIPDDRHLIIGDLVETLPPLVPRLAGRVVLIHSDVGTAETSYTPALAALFAETFPRLLAPGGLIVSDKVMSVPATRRINPPADVPTDRYFMYRLDRS
jgi:hypothetical protein